MSEPERSTYEVDYVEESAHGRLTELLVDRPERGLVIDLGCGYAPHAETLREHGFTFVGCDLDRASVDAIVERGFEAHLLDLGDIDAVRSLLQTIVGRSDVALVAVLAVDVLEHLPEPWRLLAMVHPWLQAHDTAVFGVSIPHVGHRDIAAKLLAGRWDVTRTGLLDRTHLRFFTEDSLGSLMGGTGFVETARNDRRIEHSDQHWPADLPTLSVSARLGHFLRSVRQRADDGPDLYQFIRLYTPTGRIDAAETFTTAPADTSPVFLTVVVDARADAGAHERVVRALGAQTSERFEVIDVATLGERGEGAAGRYVTITGGDATFAPNWVEQFEQTASTLAGGGGAILRSVHETTAETAQARFGELDDVAAASEIWAIPRSALEMVGRADAPSGLPLLVELLVDLVGVCGVVDTGVAALDNAPRVEIDPGVLRARLDHLDRDPHLAPPGSLAWTTDVRDTLDSLQTEVERLRRDNAWLNGELGQVPVRLLRRVLRRPASPSGGSESS